MNDNVIKGPWKDQGQHKEEQKKIAEDMSFIENMTETVMVQFIHTMNEMTLISKTRILVWRLVL